MSLGERDAFHLALKELAGEVRDSEISMQRISQLSSPHKSNKTYSSI
jgi:hypothetical protein